MTNFTIKCILSFAFFVMTINAAQNIWLSPGIGMFAVGDKIGITQAFGNVNVRIGNVHIQGRGASIINNRDNGGIGFKQVVDGGLLCGYFFELNRFVNLSVNGGLSFVYATRVVSLKDTTQISQNSFLISDAVRTHTYRGAGIPISIEMLFVVSKNFGIGISGLANFNPSTSYFGCVLMAEFGVLK